MERTTQSTARVFSVVLFVILGVASKLAAGEQIGVCYGMLGSNLPSRPQAISLIQSNNIGKVRLYNPDPDALNAMKSTTLEIIVGVANTDLQNIAGDASAATGWVNDNVVKYNPAKINYIAVGNEVSDHPEFLQYLLPAMKNIQTAVNAAGLQNQIKVSTALSTSVLAKSSPPSAGAFADEGTMKPILQFLSDNGAPFMAHIYPYLAYTGNKQDIKLEYALFRPTTPVNDNGNGKMYNNLFDAIFDAIVAAMGKSGFPNIPIVVTESGWPSDGGDSATKEYAQTYNNNLIKHVLSGNGTPVRGGITIPTYIFALFNEDQKKPPGVENHFGLFNPDSTPSYPVSFRSLSQSMGCT